MNDTNTSQKSSEDILKPDQDNKSIEKPKKKSHKLRWTLIILFIIFVLLPVFLIGYTGLFSIPILSDIFGSKNPIDLGVKISEEALNSGMEKTPWTLDELPNPSSTSPLDSEPIFSGSVAVTNDITSEEFSSFVDNRFQSVDELESIQVKFNEGGAELSLKLKEYMDVPIYIKSDITTLPDKTLAFDVKSIKIGRLPIPGKYLDEFEEAATDFINDRIIKVSGFSIEKLEFKDNFVDFVGTYPEKVERGN